MIDVSGTLHLYSGHRGELFFVFDDDVAQKLYEMDEFDIDNEELRRVWVSIGRDRFIHRRTLSFSKKQSEIKVSLCARGSKDNLGSLTSLYDWFAPDEDNRPDPFPVLGVLWQQMRSGEKVWELHIQEPLESVVPPGLPRREKSSRALSAWSRRREIQERELRKVGRLAEQLAVEIALNDFPDPRYSCLWRDAFLDSERPEIRMLGLIADIDIWDNQDDRPAAVIEVKAQKVSGLKRAPCFYLSRAELRTYHSCVKSGFNYYLWLFQYQDRGDFEHSRDRVRLIVYEDIQDDWLRADEIYLVKPTEVDGVRYEIAG